ncbi:Sugar transporter SemiSWEET [Candidatus Phycorickettsia trachydisci]|uniref:Sugar transporter SemiSWEET n=1 Tax=Candidatus Phycorickettsia trachydisci TaxID=2115978 RepID=A0A2P1P906_9RICK|nr:SemiSWEET transporter [Candidatus Phycorickettsia trachydisci]AVP87743.1 Sugar transporter SemiSWEET [Candidatus Phycorickettsia trachydisci]
MNDYMEYLGMLAGFCTTVAFVPQLVKVVKTRAAQDISTSMYLIFIIGLILWIIYGVYRASLPIIIANSCTLLFASAILFVKFLIDKSSS